MYKRQRGHRQSDAARAIFMFDAWTWRDGGDAAAAKKALVGVFAVCVIVVGGLVARLASMRVRRRRGTFEATRRRRRRAGE